MLKKFASTKMPFREAMRDEDGNIKYDKNGSPMYTKVFYVVRHNPYYIIK